MKKTASLFLSLVFSSLAFGNNFSDIWNQSSYGDFVNSENKKVSLNIGYGNYTNRLNPIREKYLNTTNDSFFSVGAKLNHAKLQVLLPQSSSDSERQSKVDTHMNIYSLAYDVNQNLTVAADYNKITGYYYESKENGVSTYHKMSSLSIKEVNLTAYYTFNGDHKSFAVENQIYERQTDSGSWIWISKIKNVNLNNLTEMNGISDLGIQSNISSAEVYLLDSSFGYSKNFFWSHWFLGGAFGLGINAGSVSSRLVDGENQKHTQFSGSYFFTASTGYINGNFRLAAFANTYDSSIQMDSLNMTVTNGSSGLYLGYAF